jgi:hypothetical protein
MKIDAFCRTVPRLYSDRMLKLDPADASANIRKRVPDIPFTAETDVRFVQMGKSGDGYRQIINIAAPPLTTSAPRRWRGRCPGWAHS